MDLVPTQDDVVRVLRETGALRDGHFRYPDGTHSNHFLQVPLAMRDYQHAKMLSVGLSRLLRANSEIRAILSELSIVSPATAGLPVAYGICEALRAKQVYWAERECHGAPYRFRQYLEPQPKEQVVLVDDTAHTGSNLADLKATVESYKAKVIAIAVIVYDPTPQTHNFGVLPFYHLARIEAIYYADQQSCKLCKEAQPAIEAWL